jgi:hypothetical protein
MREIDPRNAESADVAVDADTSTVVARTARTRSLTSRGGQT